jgi:hypothetical protein
VTQQLSEMRGAAMKLGQILSMDSGELLPKELTDILASLRADASSMPDEQLEGHGRPTAATGSRSFASSTATRSPRRPSARCTAPWITTAASWR